MAKLLLLSPLTNGGLYGPAVQSYSALCCCVIDFLFSCTADANGVSVSRCRATHNTMYFFDFLKALTFFLKPLKLIDSTERERHWKMTIPFSSFVLDGIDFQH
jgi:hypothetical protein